MGSGARVGESWSTITGTFPKGFQIRRAHLAFDRLLTMRLARHGVKSGYWNYLRALWIEDCITQRQLSEITSVTETTTVALLKGMSEEGLVERVRDSGVTWLAPEKAG